MDFQRLYKKNRQLVWGVLIGVLSFLIFRFTSLSHYLPIDILDATAYILSWNISLVVYLGMMLYMMINTEHADIIKRSKQEYEKKRVMFILVIVAAISSVVAIIKELGAASQTKGVQFAFHLGLTLSTIVLSWLFIHTLFGLYYAHFYYHDDHDDDYPLDFPHDSEPDYFDFLYFSFGIGVAGQSSDVSFVSKILRRIGIAHSLLSFFFNTAILALMIEMAASLVNQ